MSASYVASYTPLLRKRHVKCTRNYFGTLNAISQLCVGDLQILHRLRVCSQTDGMLHISPLKNLRLYCHAQGAFASRMSHSCTPNCQAVVMACGGRLTIAVYTLRHVHEGEELTFDYASVTGSRTWDIACCAHIGGPW
jgi:hypothetical protein